MQKISTILKSLKNQQQNRSGSALLVAILLMSVLSLITIGLSQLVASETKQISDMIKTSTAEYLAEGGSELAQLIYYNIEPGYEAQFDRTYSLAFTDSLPNSPTQELKFSLKGTTNHVPIRPNIDFKTADEGFDQQKATLFQKLPPGETVDIFLTKSANTHTSPQLDFEVQYYAPALSTSTLISGTDTAALDVLLFKLSGEQKSGNPDSYAIDFITEYFPASTSVSTPSSLGTRSTTQHTQGNFFEYSDGQEDQNIEINIVPPEDDDSTEAPTVTFSNLQEKPEKKSFSEFLANHDNNAISLTNALNLAFVTIDSSTFTNANQYQQILEETASIYYRVCTPSCSEAEGFNIGLANQSNIARTPPSTILTSPSILIESQGTYQNTTKNLNLFLSRPNALSVFNFALYHTKQ